MKIYICPVCRKKLKLSNNSYRCANGHSFDISAKGYVNLLTTKGRNPKNAGDNTLMVKARSDFLDKDYYLPLAEKLSQIMSKALKGCARPVIIDSGCGEGYYAHVYAKTLKNADIYGIDISKNAVAHGASRCRNDNIGNVHFAAASSFELPFRELTADMIVSVFAPVSNDEYARVLKKGGRLIVVSPAARHLFGLKAAVYDTPYENKPNTYGLRKFELADETLLEYDVKLECNDDIKNLFAMTPYFYKTSAEAKAKLDDISSLTTECAFTIQTYIKK